MDCSSFREYQPAPPWSSLQAAVWTSAPLWSSPQTAGKYLLCCGLANGSICSRPGEAIEVIKHKIPENIAGCTPLLAATAGVVDTSEVSVFN